MVFSSFLFLFLFLPVTSILYIITPRSYKNSVLLLASALFYAWGAPIVLPFLLISCVFDFAISLYLVPGRLTEKKRRLLFGLACAGNLSALLYYKYFNFLGQQISEVFKFIGIEPLSFAEVILPIGISFFTFHKISYLGDVFRAKVLPSRSIVDYCLYILFFPQLIAGPIIRYADVATQFKERIHSIDGVYQGLTRLCLGLGKKILIADSLGAVVTQVLALDATQLSSLAVWLAVVCYSFQIYFDFSGYSDMAIGLAKVFGFTFKENFNRPYRAQNFTDFWRRWHISLSTFMREYLYIPLGGNRGTAFRTTLNLWLTFLLSGLWHGASWNFVVWGAFHGAFLTIDKLGWEKFSKRLPSALNISLTFLLVTIGWVFFRVETLEQAFSLLSVMFGLGEAQVFLPRAYIIDNRQIVVLIVAAVLSFGPSMKFIEGLSRPRLPGFEVFKAATALAIFWLSLAALASRGYAPFLYFKF